MQEIMLCVALLLNVDPLPIPRIVERDVYGYWGRYHWETETVEVHPDAPRSVYAHEFAHFLQHRHGMMRLSRADIPVWTLDLEWLARRAMHRCG